MANRVVVKDNWVDATHDQVSEFFGACLGWVLLGGIAITGMGLLSGFQSAPRGQDPAPYMIEHVVDIHKASWGLIFTAVDTTWESLQESRPES